MTEPVDYIKTYRLEAAELLSDMETAALDLEADPDNAETIDRIFRDVHTIKGSGAMFGFDGVAAFTHRLETLLEKVRQGEMAVDRRLIDLILASRDNIKAMLENGPESDDAGNSVSSAIDAMIQSSGSGETPSPEPSSDAPTEASPNNMYHIRFSPSLDIMETGLDPRVLFKELGEMGQCFVAAHSENIPGLDALVPEQCYINWELLLISSAELSTVADVFVFLDDRSQVKIEEVKRSQSENKELIRRLGDILVEMGHATPKDVNRILGPIQEKIVQMFQQSGVVSTKDIIEAVKVQQSTIGKTEPKAATEESLASVRVPSEKLDRLINYVGEIVITLSHLRQLIGQTDQAEFLDNINIFEKWIESLSGAMETLDHAAGDLRDCALSMRMLPIGSLFGKFRRLSRDLSSMLGKDIRLSTTGGETELDKSVIERLSDPLMHLIRNSADHGIELPAERAALGKPREGEIRLTARQRGANIEILIEDDGRGIDADAIRKKAEQLGLIQEGARLLEEDLFSLICHPGLSTARTVTDVSGRGVGMDVVKRHIDDLGGSIRMEGVAGRFCRLTLTLPLSLAIAEGLLVKVGNESYVLPMAQVEECVSFSSEMAAGGLGENLLAIRGRPVSCCRLRDVIGISEEPVPSIPQIVVVRNESETMALTVDEIVGTVQVVVKPLDRYTRQFNWLLGGTILGNGAAALIIDAIKLAAGNPQT